VYVVLCLIVFGCQYQCYRLPGKTDLRNDLLCVEWDVKPYTHTHSHPFTEVLVSVAFSDVTFAVTLVWQCTDSC